MGNKIWDEVDKRRDIYEFGVVFGRKGVQSIRKT